MSVEDGSGGEMTLVFELSAAEELADPQGAFTEARGWSRHVGIVANDTEAAESFVREHGLEPDFDLEGRDKWLAMKEIHNGTDTNRHVFVGTSIEDERLADTIGWEFFHVTEAAEKAGWDLADDATPGLRARLAAKWWWPFVL